MEENNKEELLKEEITPENNENEVEVVKSERQTQSEKKEETPTKDRKGFAIASMVLGIISLVLFCIWYISVPCSILAIIFAKLSLKSSKRGMAIAGLTTGIIGFILIIIVYILIVALGISIYQNAVDVMEDNIKYNNNLYDYKYNYKSNYNEDDDYNKYF